MHHMRIVIVLPLLAACVGNGSTRGAAVGSEEPSASGEAPVQTIGSIERLDPAIDSLIPPDAVIEVLADGFDWSEGPVWIEDGEYLLFSDVPQNRIYLWKEGTGHPLIRMVNAS